MLQTDRMSRCVARMESRFSDLGFTNIVSKVVGRQIVLHGTTGSHEETCVCMVTSVNFSDVSSFLDISVSAETLCGYPLKRLVVVNEGTEAEPRYALHGHGVVPNEEHQIIDCEMRFI